MTDIEKADIDQLVQHYRSTERFDVDNGLKRLHRNISADGQQSVRRQAAAGRRNWLSIAASILVVLSAATGIFYFATSLATTEIVAAADGETIALPDGTEVTLKAGTSLSYHKSYGETARSIELDGEAFFSVIPDAERPFLASQGDVTLRVVGTTFNLKADPTADFFEVEVATGKVVLETMSTNLPVAAKECGSSKGDGKLTKMPAPHLNRHAWRTGKMVFEKTLLSEAVEIIERAYDVKIKLSKKDIKQCDFALTATFNQASLEEVLAHFEKLSSGRFIASKSGRVYRLMDWCK